MPVANWKTQVYNVIGSVLFDNPRRVVRFLVRDAGGNLVDRRELPAPVRRLAETPVPEERACLKTIQFVHHVVIPPGGRHVNELHVHPDAEELIVVMGGRGRLQIGDDVTKVLAGDVAYVPSDTEHVLSNDSGELLMALFINVPVGAALTSLGEPGP